LVQQGTLREALTKFYQMPKVASIENKINTYSVSEQKDRNEHGSSNHFGPKWQQKNRNIKKNIFGMGLQISLDLQQQLKFLVVPLPLGLHPSPLWPC